MKLTNRFISRLVIVAVSSSLPVFAAYGQNSGDATTGDDAHRTVDSPYLRPKPKSSATAAAQTKLSSKDQKFLSQIAAGGVQAVEDSKIAEKEGGPTVKSVAARIVAERSRSNKELMDLAKKKGLGLGVDKIHARNMGTSNFDKQFVHTLGRDLDEDVKLLQTAAQSSDDKDVKAWAAKTLPTVKQQASAVKQAGGKA
jgi:putative membrane protein